MITLLSFLFVLGILIFVHELGHFVMARRIGVRVLTFSLGFGPKLFSVTRGDTEYCVSAIPLGGYVKMAGETAEDTRTGAADEFLSKTKWQRFQVLVMGPVMNLALAVLVLAVVLYQGTEVPLFQDQPVIVGTMTADSVAKAAGLQLGDRIVSIDGVDTPDWERFSRVIAHANRSVQVVYDRHGRIERKQMVATRAGETGLGSLGVLPAVRPQILAVSAGFPAADAGLRARDVVLAANGERGIEYNRLLEVIKTHPGKVVTFEIERGGQPQTVQVTPRLDGETGRIGADISAFEVRTINPDRSKRWRSACSATGTVRS